MIDLRTVKSVFENVKLQEVAFIQSDFKIDGTMKKSIELCTFKNFVGLSIGPSYSTRDDHKR